MPIIVPAPAVIELGGYPKIKLDRKGGSAVRKFLFEQADLNAFTLHCFPSPIDGYGTFSAFPGLPWLVVTSVDIDPFDDNGPDGTQGTDGRAINKYTKGGLVATLSYTVPEDDQQQQPSEHGGDGTGPGGDQGSTGGEGDNPVTYVKHSLSIGGEMLQWPAASLEWENARDLADDAELPDKGQVKVTGGAMIGCVIPIIEHQVAWAHVQRPPWSAIRSCVGRVNSASFCGAPRETLLFLGCEAEREYTSAGAQAWNVTYKFSEKNYAETGPQSWNHFLRPATGRFERIRKKRITNENGQQAVAAVADDIKPGDTEIYVLTESYTFPRQTPFRIKIRDEEMQVTRVDVIPLTGKTRLVVTRGINGTQPSKIEGVARVDPTQGYIYDFANFSALFPSGVQ